MRRLKLIGIGAGNPDYITIQAINALNEVDVFFVIDKGAVKQDLILQENGEEDRIDDKTVFIIKRN